MALTPPCENEASRLCESSPVLELEGLAHGYGERTVLQDINLTVPAGSLAVLAGPSGCGKSTMLRLIAGLEMPTRGRVLLAGEDFTGRPGRVGLVFQEAALYPWLTVAENAAFGLHIQGRPGNEISARVRDLLELVGLTEVAQLYPHQLSGGMAQRAALARALGPFPRVLLLDEPFGSVDQRLRNRLQGELVRLWQATGSTIILVTHSVDEAVFVGERILLMASSGRLAGDIQVPLAYPRDRHDACFLELREDVFSWLSEESDLVDVQPSVS